MPIGSLSKNRCSIIFHSVSHNVFLIGFSLTVRKTLDTQLNLGWDSANNKQNIYFAFGIKTRHRLFSRDNGKTTRKEISKLFLCDHLTLHNGMENVTEMSILKRLILSLQLEKLWTLITMRNIWELYQTKCYYGRKTNSYWFDIWRLIKKRLFQKKSKQGLGGEWSWRHTFLTKIDGIFRFVILLVETLEKTKPHPWKNRQNCATPLGTFNAKNKDPWKLHMVLFQTHLEIPLLF